jgi:hypothetical protein
MHDQSVEVRIGIWNQIQMINPNWEPIQRGEIQINFWQKWFLWRNNDINNGIDGSAKLSLGDGEISKFAFAKKWATEMFRGKCIQKSDRAALFPNRPALVGIAAAKNRSKTDFDFTVLRLFFQFSTYSLAFRPRGGDFSNGDAHFFRPYRSPGVHFFWLRTRRKRSPQIYLVG